MAAVLTALPTRLKQNCPEIAVRAEVVDPHVPEMHAYQKHLRAFLTTWALEVCRQNLAMKRALYFLACSRAW